MNTTTTKTQTRGICQCCGREQAVLASGRMSKHGYTVEHGWFNGVCSGDKFKPMQVERAQTDHIVRIVLKDCDKLEQTAADLKSGKIHPQVAPSHKRDDKGRVVSVMVPFADAEPWQQKQAVEAAIWNTEQRARAGRSFAADMERLANTYHGTALRVVPVESGPAPIKIGERRTAPRGVLRATSVEGGRVYWKDERGFKSWTGTQAWRKMPLVTE